MIHDLYNWVLAWAEHPNATIALFWIAFAESSFFPIPPDVLLIGMCVANPERSLYFALITSVGSLLGGMAGYGLGRGAGRPLVKRLLSEKNLHAAEALYNRFDIWAIGIAGFTPIPYKVFSISAGAFSIRFVTFVIASALSRSTRFFIVATAFYLWGDHIHAWIEEYFNVATLIISVALVGGFLVIHYVGKRLVNES